MLLNRAFEWKVMIIRISRELALFNFERLDILLAWIGHLSQSLWPFEFSLCFHVKFRASLNIMCLNRTSVWKVMTIGISWELPMFNFNRLNIVLAWTGHPSQKLLPFKFALRFDAKFRACHLSEKLWRFQFLESFRCSILSISIYYAPQSDLRVKSYDHLNFSRASIVQFRASRYIIRLNRTSKWKVMTIWISRELPFFNF